MEPSASPATANLKTLTLVIYALYALALIAGVTAVIAVVLNYLKRDEVRGTWLESHFRWQIGTFWWALVWTLAGTLAWVLLLGWLVWGIAGIWYIYRIARGWLNLNDDKPMPVS